MTFNRLDYSQIDEEIVYKLPRFEGAGREDIVAYLQEFHRVCFVIKPREVKLMNLSLRDLEQLFLMRFTPPPQQKALREQIMFIQQFELESFANYYERFLKLLRWFPNNGQPEYMLIEYFMQGMIPYDRYKMDVMAGGQIINCTLNRIWDIFNARTDETALRAPYHMQQEL